MTNDLLKTLSKFVEKKSPNSKKTDERALLFRIGHSSVPTALGTLSS